MFVYPGTSIAFWFVLLIAAYKECYLAYLLTKSKGWSAPAGCDQNKIAKKKDMLFFWKLLLSPKLWVHLLLIIISHLKEKMNKGASHLGRGCQTHSRALG